MTTPQNKPLPTHVAKKLSHLDKPQTNGPKPSRMDTYPWIYSCSRLFDMSGCDYAARTRIMLQALPIDKKSSFIHIGNWIELKAKLICNFGNIAVFLWEAHNQFLQVKQPLQSMWDLADHLVPRVEKLSLT